MASPEQLSLQITAIDAALIVSREQFAGQTSGSAEQKQLAVAINQLEQEKESLQAQLSSFTTANVTASTIGAGVVPQTTVDEFGQVVAVDSPAAASVPQTTVDEFGQIVPVTGPAPVGVPQTTVNEFGQTVPNPDFPGNNLASDSEDSQSRRVAAEQKSAINQATLQARYKQPANDDWRVRLSLSVGANYLYKDPNPGILAPLSKTDGVVFPYTPTIDTSYVANYEKTDLVHSNYRGAFYKNSAVQDVNIRGMFTAQDTSEAAYMLAVIHFFRSVTKMFYGKDAQRGAPPPLVYLTGFGDFQFAGHPCVVTNFAYTLPSDVDYIRANNPNNYGTDLLNRREAPLSSPTPFASQLGRLINSALVPGALPAKPTQSPITQSVTNTSRATYVPTKIEISITLLPMQTRDQISKQFSLKDFANGKLIQGGFW
jgi:hypothetical protein